MECGDKELTTEKVTSIIEKLGGNVYTGEVETVADVSYVITSQKEIIKAIHKVSKTHHGLPPGGKLCPRT